MAKPRPGAGDMLRVMPRLPLAPRGVRAKFGRLGLSQRILLTGKYEHSWGELMTILPLDR